MAITFLREPGELVKPGDVVAQFDTTQQEFNLREAEADLAEAEQQVIKAEADAAGLARRSALSGRFPRPRKSNRRRSKFARIRFWRLFRLARTKSRWKPPRTGRTKPKRISKIRKRRRTPASPFKKRPWKGAGRWRKMRSGTIDSMVLKAKTAGYVNVQRTATRTCCITASSCRISRSAMRRVPARRSRRFRI